MTQQQLIIAGDLNGHIGAEADGFSSVHGGFGYGVRNEEGRTILEFAAAHDLVFVNSFFKKRDAHLITYHSGDHDTQIDYMLVRRGDLRVCKDCKVFLGENNYGRIADVEQTGKHHQRGDQGNPRSGCRGFENSYWPEGVMVVF
ncbi:craniofacial development protein 2-like protein [Tanacetum coccineum]